jgi:hypothetical protein
MQSVQLLSDAEFPFQRATRAERYRSVRAILAVALHAYEQKVGVTVCQKAIITGKSVPYSLYPSYFVPKEFFANMGNKKHLTYRSTLLRAERSNPSINQGRRRR